MPHGAIGKIKLCIRILFTPHGDRLSILLRDLHMCRTSHERLSYTVTEFACAKVVMIDDTIRVYAGASGLCGAQPNSVSGPGVSMNGIVGVA